MTDKDTETFRYHTKTEKDWERKHVQNFWNWYSTNNRSENYFARMVGDSLVNYLKKQVSLEGSFLDYGCGRGDLINHLIKRDDLSIYGVEFSHEELNLVNGTFSKFPNWHGAKPVNSLPVDYADDMFDTITFVETIEHLKDDDLDATLKELFRILKPAGHLMVTTPFDEDLSEKQSYCPFCNCEFHRMQHMQSFSIESLTSLLNGYGFTVTSCDNVNLGDYHTSPKKYVANKVRTLAKSMVNKVQKSSYQLEPHLVAIATKKAIAVSRAA